MPPLDWKIKVCSMSHIQCMPRFPVYIEYFFVSRFAVFVGTIIVAVVVIVLCFCCYFCRCCCCCLCDSISFWHYNGLGAASETCLSKYSDIVIHTPLKNSFSGSEWDYVILSLVRSLSKEEIDPQPSLSWLREHLGFLTDEHQINVGLTRARKGLCIIGMYDHEVLYC